MTPIRPRTFQMPASKRELYMAGNGTCGDLLASAISAFVVGQDGKVSADRIAAIALANGIAPKTGANVGQYRMNMSNMLRARLRKGHDVVVGDRLVAGVPQAVAA